MKRWAVAGLATLLLLPIFVSAQVSVTALVADIPFQFTAGGKSFPAGTYEVRVGSLTEVLTLTNTKTRETFNVPVLTRLGSRSPQEASLVFDKVKDQNVLSELYFPGEDGFHVAGTPGQHSHVVVKAKKS